jgi:hypothetical protein
VVSSDHGIQNMTIEEEYGLAVLQEAQAICVAKNVKVRPNEFVLPARTVFNISDPASGFEGLADVNVFHATTPINVLD